MVMYKVFYLTKKNFWKKMYEVFYEIALAMKALDAGQSGVQVSW